MLTPKFSWIRTFRWAVMLRQGIFGGRSPETRRQISDCLTDDPQILDSRILHHGVRNEHAPARSDMGLDSGNGVPSVPEEDCSVFHSGRASARTHSRKCGLRPFSVTTSTAQPNRSSRSG